jgi:hypothetical protein
MFVSLFVFGCAVIFVSLLAWPTLSLFRPGLTILTFCAFVAGSILGGACFGVGYSMIVAGANYQLQSRGQVMGLLTGSAVAALVAGVLSAKLASKMRNA